MTAEIERLKELLAKATLPWKAWEPADDPSYAQYAAELSGRVQSPDADIADVFDDAPRDLIVEAVNFLPALIARIEEVEAVLARIVRVLTDYGHELPDGLGSIALEDARTLLTPNQRGDNRDLSHWADWSDIELIEQAACACQRRDLSDDEITRDAIIMNIITPLRQRIAKLEAQGGPNV